MSPNSNQQSVENASTAQAESKGYATYIQGANAVFSDGLLRMSKANVAALVAALRDYRSIWRELHIDGFEPHQLPTQAGVHYQFYYTKTPRPDASNFCDKAPAGWYCTRDAGHDGPCAAKPVKESVMNESEAFELIHQGHQFPHCDPRILHAPGKCQFCDKEPEWQAMRIILNINFTGEHDGDKIVDPATHARSYDLLNAWSGNKARP